MKMKNGENLSLDMSEERVFHVFEEMIAYIDQQGEQSLLHQEIRVTSFLQPYHRLHPQHHLESDLYTQTQIVTSRDKSRYAHQIL